MSLKETLQNHYSRLFGVASSIASRLKKKPVCVVCGAEAYRGVVCRRCHLSGAPVHKSAGLALTIVLAVLVMITVLSSASLMSALAIIRTSSAVEQEAIAFYVAEGAADVALAELMAALEDGYLEDDELAAIAPPAVFLDLGWTFPIYDAVRTDSITIETVTDGPFAGMFSLTQPLELRVRTVNSVGASAGYVLGAKAQAIPIFQFGVFFEGDLEATNGPPLTFEGRVHSNGNIYLDSDNAWYRDVVTTPGEIYLDRKDFHSSDDGVYIADAGGFDVLLEFDSRTIPDGDSFKARSNLDFDGRLQTGASYGVGALRVPLPGGMDSYELIRPREVSDSEQEKRAKYAYRAQAEINVGALDYTADAFYDGREERFVDVFDLDVAAFQAGTPDSVEIVYIVFPPSVITADPQMDGVFPVVRISNGASLTRPLTIATEVPLYIFGDFNTGVWQPAAIAADAVTILSPSWSDSNPPLSTANETTINIAIMAGLVPTPCDHEEFGCPGGYEDFYSGGIENFPRFLEDWGGVPLHYRGSLVSVYESQKATGTWNGSYYDAPIRDWGFDTAFEDPANLPAGTPVVGFLVRTASRPMD